MRGVRITVICDELVRIEESPTSSFSDDPSLVAIHAPTGSPMHESLAVYTMGANQVRRRLDIETSRLTLAYVPDGKALSASNLSVRVKHPLGPKDLVDQRGEVVWHPGVAQRYNLGGTLETLDGVRGPLDVGDGLLSRDGWFVLDDSGTAVLVDGWAQTRASRGRGDGTDWYFFAYGSDYLAALSALRRIAGGVPMPRKYALGSWYSRYWPYSSADYRGLASEFQVHAFPLDVMVLDMDWHRDGWTGWSWNRTLLPDAEDLVADLHERGLAVTLNLHPSGGVGPHEDQYAAFMRSAGRDPASGETLPFDAGDERQMKALFDQVHAPLESPVHGGARSGVDFWWLDWQQEREVRSRPGLTNLRWLNHLYFKHTSGVPSLATGGRFNKRGLSFSRWAGWGDHRCPIHFSGDAHTGWAMLAFQVPFSVQAGNVGCFYWSHDIGGHFGPRLEEATARWVQFGACSAALRLHSARSPRLDRRPWSNERRFTDSMRRAYQLRSTLMPYIYTCAAECSMRMIPLLRPMYLTGVKSPEAATSELAYRASGQYLLGGDILVAPIVSPGVGRRCVATQRVWFDPEPGRRSAWRNWFTMERHQAGSEILASADIDSWPMYVREGVPVPMQAPGGMRSTSAVTSELVVRLASKAPPPRRTHLRQAELTGWRSSLESSMRTTENRRRRTLGSGQSRRSSPRGVQNSTDTGGSN